MRPLTGTILTIDEKAGLKVKLESGLITTLPYDETFSAGEEIMVGYDFTKNRVTKIIKEKCYE